MNNSLSRRSFIRKSSTAAIVGMLSGWADAATPTDRLGNILPQRILTRNGEKTTAFGLGGHHIGKLDDAALAERICERSIELGVRFFDNARVYFSGRAEEYFGRFLVPKYRDDIFIMTKSAGKTLDAMRTDLEESLKAMRTDRVDLWQIHGIGKPDEVDDRVANGVIDAALEAREQGKTRYIGFTGHANPKTHLHFLSLLEKRGIELDTCQMPLNLVDPQFESFEKNVLPVLTKRSYGVLAMKTMAGGSMMGKSISRDPNHAKRLGVPMVNELANISFAEMHQYVYSLPISVLISGCMTIEELEHNVQTLVDYKNLTDEKKTALLARAAPFAGEIVENYKRIL